MPLPLLSCFEVKENALLYILHAVFYTKNHKIFECIQIVLAGTEYFESNLLTHLTFTDSDKRYLTQCWYKNLDSDEVPCESLWD